LKRAIKQSVVERNLLNVDQYAQRILSGTPRRDFALNPTGSLLPKDTHLALQRTVQSRATLQTVNESIATAQHRHATGTSYYYHHSKLNAIYSADLHGSGVQVPRDKRADG
jgi:hypothetical protein